jgi:hypothetical protein
MSEKSYYSLATAVELRLSDRAAPLGRFNYPYQ